MSEVFEPFHVEQFAAQASDLTHESLTVLVGSASMTKSNVIDNQKAKQIMEENEAKRRTAEEQRSVITK